MGIFSWIEDAGESIWHGLKSGASFVKDAGSWVYNRGQDVVDVVTHPSKVIDYVKTEVIKPITSTVVDVTKDVATTAKNVGDTGRNIIGLPSFSEMLSNPVLVITGGIVATVLIPKLIK